jgi:hypothetical protein
MMDLNEDEYLTFNDLFVVIMCATRGVAKIRGYAEMPSNFVEKLLIEAFRVSKSNLSDMGEMSMYDLKNVLLSDELVSQYMSNLGVPVVEVDAAALVTKRSNVLKEAIALQAQIAETMCAIEDLNELADQNGERGGDARLIRISDLTKEEQSRNREEMARASLMQSELETQQMQGMQGAKSAKYQSTKGGKASATLGRVKPAGSQGSPGKNKKALLSNAAASASGAAATSATASVSVSASASASASASTSANAPSASASGSTHIHHDPSEAPDFVHASHPARKYLKPDNSLFSDADMTADTKGSRNVFGEGFRNVLKEVWAKLPQDQVSVQ